MTDATVRVFSLFSSIQGESTRQGLPCVFVRLAGCPLRCSYCDTRTACESPGEPMSLGEVVAAVRAFGPNLVEVTGGEPLAQSGTLPLLTNLAEAGFEVLLETSGALPIRDVDQRVHVVLDLKTPGSGMSERMDVANFCGLDPVRHEIKIVVTSREDFEWALRFLRELGIEGRIETLFSPVLPLVNPPDLASWILETRCRGRLQLQLHRIIWPTAEEER